MQLSQYYLIDKKKYWLLISSFYILIVALIGVIMRLKFVTTFPVFEFNFILHAHSHAAMLGWVYSALFIAFLYRFFPESIFSLKTYSRIFWLIQFSVLGMLITFPIRGYWALSIAFSSLHIIITYWFVIRFVKDARINKIYDRYPSSMMFIYGGLFFLVLSTLGPWGLALITITKFPDKNLYDQAIYFYLHFQYNGWFTFGLIGLILSKIESSKIFIYTSTLKSGYWLLFLANFPAYFLSLLGYTLTELLISIAALSAFFQIIGILFISKSFFSNKKILLDSFPPVAKMLLYISIFSLLVKFVLQLVSLPPYFANIVFSNRDIIIGYIHLIMLGFVTCGLFWWFSGKDYFRMEDNSAKYSIITFIIGFFISEILLFMQILVYYNLMPSIPYHLILFISSVFMLIGLTLFWIRQYSLFKQSS